MFIQKIVKVRPADRWHSLNYLLEVLLNGQNAKKTHLIEDYLNNWIRSNSPNRIFTKPPKEQLLPCIYKTNVLLTNLNKEKNIYSQLLIVLEDFST